MKYRSQRGQKLSGVNVDGKVKIWQDADELAPKRTLAKSAFLGQERRQGRQMALLGAEIENGTG
jgi:hypothetical protein